MGNCQAAEAATVVIVHPGSKVERIYWSVSANEIMASNPGHYVALVITSASAKTEDGRPVKQLKLLRPDDTLHIGSVYRLISFEDVLKEFAAKKCVKLGRLLKDNGRIRTALEKKRESSRISKSEISKSVHHKVEQEVNRPGSNSRISSSSSNSSSSSSSSRGVGRQQQQQHHHYQSGGHWRPALQSIAEVGN